ncbi:hypothetical protein T484DRAFT_1846170 [Baffinella frigidus]|nr:hypothetical protein T484DRAFT_1846170 [Cryptophyta sp. CCMP2293]
MTSRGTPRTPPRQPQPVEPQAPASLSPSLKSYSEDLRFLQTLRKRLTPAKASPSAPTSGASTPRSANKQDARPQSAGPHARSRLSLIGEHLRTGSGPAGHSVGAARSLNVEFKDSTEHTPPPAPARPHRSGMGSPAKRAAAHLAPETGRNKSAWSNADEYSTHTKSGTPSQSPPSGGRGGGGRGAGLPGRTAGRGERGGGVPGDQSRG